MLGKTERVIRNGQARDTDYIEHKTQMKTNRKKHNS